ncbi:TMEM175 family protein [Micromonospora lupini]|uniref:TMEM175 family protein n=1 Tax=Micromonospora lupini TaxID=285679 RepID=UPI0007C7F77D|nr:TMEM175 family protein [Micromonospora lupini]
MSAAQEGVQAGDGGPAVTDAGRLAAFSDGVFAIVITLLVLDLRVPEFHEGELAEGLLGEGPSYLAFAVSFIYVGVLWLNHHAVLQRVRGTTPAFSSINLAILFGVVIIPFPTAVLASALADGNTDDLRVAVVLYAFAASLMSAPWWVLFAYVRRHPALRADTVDQEQVRVQEARPIVGLILYGLTGVLGWLVTPLLGLIGVVVMIIFHGATSQGLRHGLWWRRRNAHRS